MKLINKVRKLTFEFEDVHGDNKGIMVTSKTKGKLTINDILAAKKLIDNRLNNYGKDKRK